MKRAWRGAMPVALTLPLGLERKPRVRQRRLRRLAVGALILGAALLAAGLWLPAKAELAQRLLGRASGPTVGVPAPVAQTWTTARAAVDRQALSTLAVGAELTLRGSDGAVQTYEVTALDVVDAERAELAPDSAGSVVLATPWPFDAAPVGGRWRYVVSARRVEPSTQLVAASTGAF